MKGLTGLIVAGVLGLLGIALNWFYLENKAKNLQTVSFLGIKEEAGIEVGDTFVSGHFTEVTIPKSNAKNLEDFVYLWADRETVIGTRATENYIGGELFFKQDYRTPQFGIELKDNERLLPISVSERSPLIQPGDDVSFWIPSSETGEGEVGELLGPFRVGAIGNQVGNRDVMKAYKIPQMQGNQLGIIVTVEGGEFDQRTTILMDRINRSDGRSIKVVLHPRPSE